MNTIYNLTQHQPTAAQMNAGVGQIVDGVPELLSFDEPPTFSEMVARAEKIVGKLPELTDNTVGKAMIGGAPFFMPVLARALYDRCYEPVYAFSRREVVETTEPSGSVKKTAVFRHVGFVKDYTL